MRQSLFPSDDDLPTWLHTLLLVVIVSLFGIPLIWDGLHAIFNHHLEAVGGFDFGEYIYGPEPLEGKAATVAGFSLIFLGSAFLAIAGVFSRLTEGRMFFRLLPLGLLGVDLALSFWVKALTR